MMSGKILYKIEAARFDYSDNRVYPDLELYRYAKDEKEAKKIATNVGRKNRESYRMMNISIVEK